MCMFYSGRARVLPGFFTPDMNIKLKVLTGAEGLLNKAIDRCTAALVSVREQRYLEQFVSRESDIYISTFLRSGTTWVQMIVYQLLTDGNMRFNHIYDVSPWLSNEAVLGHSADRVNALASPRVFKSHDPYDKFDPNNKFRFIHVVRDGRDVALSLLHHRRNYNDVDESITDVFNEFILPDSDYNWFGHTKEWMENRHGFNIIHVHYEDLLSDFENSVLRIAGFLNVKVSERDMKRITERCSFEFMKKHEDKFGEQQGIQRVYNQFIRKGVSGGGKDALSEEQNELFARCFHEQLYGLRNSVSQRESKELMF
ncbi:MAG: sulfotransferase domain-containing protein [Cryomorphaceae bacterium]|nr:MAG: sulfotransferase domain-containing protein [Cryomorphaceae bacterium]